MALTCDDALERLRAVRNRGRLAHAYLITASSIGPSDRLLNGLAGLVLETPPDMATSHPDCHVIQPESKSRRIVIDQVRDLEHALQMKPLSGACKVAVVRDADRLQPQAANAFLKTLEEPPPGSHILLTTTVRDAVLPTILSRCIAVPLRDEQAGPPDEACRRLLGAFEAALLRKNGPDTSDAFRFARLFQGEMAALRESVSDRLDETLKAEVKIYRDSIDKGWKDGREDQIKAQTESIALRERDRRIAALAGLLAAALRHRTLPGPDTPEAVRRIAELQDATVLLGRIEALDSLRRMLATGVQESLALESGFLQVLAVS